MKTLYFSVLAVALLAAASLGQLSIGMGDFPPVGTVFQEQSTVGPVTFNLGAGGANQTWDFTAYTYAPENTTYIVAPSSTPFAGDFPAATHCARDEEGGENGYSFFRLASNGIFILGMAGTGGDENSLFILDAEALQAPLPLTYQSQWTTLMRVTYEPIPGFSVTLVDSTISVCDGWGNAITPYGTWPVLRVRDHSYTATIMTGVPVDWSEDYGYHFFTQNPLVNVHVSSEDNTSDPNFTFGHVGINLPGAASSEPLRGPLAESFAVSQNYPNPFNPTTALPLSLEKNARVSLSIYDETGRLVSSEDFELGAGDHALPINGSAWATGTYFARVSTSGQSQTVKMHLVK